MSYSFSELREDVRNLLARWGIGELTVEPQDSTYGGAVILEGASSTQDFEVWQYGVGDGQFVITGSTNGVLFVLEEDGGLGWVTPSLSNSWVDFGSGYQGARYCKDALGWVHVEGLVKSGSPDTATIFTLPAGYRPSGSLIFAVWNASGAARLTVGSDGQVSCNTGGGSGFQGINCSFYVGY